MTTSLGWHSTFPSFRRLVSRRNNSQITFRHIWGIREMLLIKYSIAMSHSLTLLRCFDTRRLSLHNNATCKPNGRTLFCLKSLSIRFIVFIFRCSLFTKASDTLPQPQNKWKENWKLFLSISSLCVDNQCSWIFKAKRSHEEGKKHDRHALIKAFHFVVTSCLSPNQCLV